MTTEAELFDTLKYRVDISPLTGTRRYYNTAQLLHREDGPAIEWPNGSKEWYQNGVRHREGGPASEYRDGTHKWWQNGKLHREDGPAIVRTDGYREWWQNDQRHRIDGPAVVGPNGLRLWCLYGVSYSKKEYLVQLKTLGHTT